MTLNRAINKYIKDISEPVILEKSVDEIKEKYLQNTKISKKKIKDTFIKDLNIAIDRKGKIVTRRLLFQNVRFRIKQTEYEFKNKILFTGHRFIPFLDTNISFEDIQLLVPDKNPISKKKIKINMNDVMIYYTLLPSYMILPEEMLDNETGIFEVWDLKEFTKKFDLKANDTIIVHCINFDKGIYTLNIEDSNQFQESFAKIRKSDRILEDALLTVFDNYPDLLIPELQLLYAYATADPWILQNPGHHFGGLLADNNLISSQKFGMEPTLCRKGEDFYQKSIEKSMEYKQTGDASSLENILQDIGSTFNEIAIKAMIHYYNWKELEKEKAIDLIHEWILPYGKEVFVSDKQQDAYFSYIEKLFDKTVKSDDKRFISDEIKDIYNVSMKLFFKIVTIIRNIDSIQNLDINSLPSEEMSNLIQIDQMLTNLFDIFETSEFDKDDENIQGFAKEIALFSEVIENIENNIMNAVKTIGS